MCTIVCNSQVRYKMFVGLGNSGQYRLNIIPIKYDTTVSDIRILQCIDSLPGGLFHSKMYNLLYADDSTRMAIQVNEGNYLFRVRYEVVEYYKNGNVKRRTYYTKHLKKYWEFNYYADASPKSTGRYKPFINHNEKDFFKNSIVKHGTWLYFNADGNLVKKEKNVSDGTYGTLVYTKDYNPPKRTFTTIMNPKHLKGTPYVIQ
ncbi:MAG: hypothetical protein ACLQQ4_11100 [Bacteroidia bacterium]